MVPEAVGSVPTHRPNIQSIPGNSIWQSAVLLTPKFLVRAQVRERERGQVAAGR